jgi:sugar lactone lactonase YvrE
MRAVGPILPLCAGDNGVGEDELRQFRAERGRLTRIVACIMLAAMAGCAASSQDSEPSVAVQDITINGSRVFPESITSDNAGNLYVGSHGGTIYRAAAGARTAEPWVVPSPENGLLSLFGVLADDRHGLLWTCSNPPFGGPPQPGAVSSIKGFSLQTAQLERSFDFPAGKPTACNDLAVAEDGTLWATDTSSGRIFTVAPGAQAMVLFAEGQDLVGVDGIAFADDGTIYINNVRTHLVQRVNRAADGGYAGLTTLTLSQPVDGPDALRPIGGNRFLQAEGPGGRVALVEVEGDRATITPIKTGLDSSPGVTRVGPVGYATEGKIGYLFDPALRGQDPGEFVIRAFPLPEGL